MTAVGAGRGGFRVQENQGCEILDRSALTADR
jgi:hypothetical protein